MKSNMKILIYILILILLDLLIFFTPLDNSLILSCNYLIISIYLIFNVFSNITGKKISLVYLVYIFSLILLNIFLLSSTNIFLSIILLILIIYQIKKTRKKTTIAIENQEPEKKDITINVDLPLDFGIEEFEHIAKEMYINMQTYFMNFEYEKLENILEKNLYKQFLNQMKVLEENDKCAVRENFEFIDFKINDFKDIDNKLVINISLGVIEDKYTRSMDSKIKKDNCSYESYYEIVYMKKKEWFISNLKLIYSHSNRKKS